MPPLGGAFLRYGSRTVSFAKVDGEATLFHFSREVPCPIVGIGIVTLTRTFIYESRCLHHALHSKPADGIINLILDFFQEFPLHGIVENRLLTVLVKEVQNVFLRLDGICKSDGSIGQSPLITGLLTFCFGNSTVAITPNFRMRR